MIPQLIEHLAMSLGDVFTLLFTVLRVAIVYLVLLFALRFSGRRQLGQLTPFDLIMLLLLSNVVQNAMIGPDNSLVGGLLGAAVLLGLNRLVANIAGLRRELDDQPETLVSQGHVLVEPMKRVGVSKSDLAVARHYEMGLNSSLGSKPARLNRSGLHREPPSQQRPQDQPRRHRHAQEQQPDSPQQSQLLGKTPTALHKVAPAPNHTPAQPTSQYAQQPRPPLPEGLEV